MEQLLNELKNVFAWTYKDLKGKNYATVFKQDMTNC
jgi:hypothetical protein